MMLNGHCLLNESAASDANVCNDDDDDVDSHGFVYWKYVRPREPEEQLPLIWDDCFYCHQQLAVYGYIAVALLRTHNWNGSNNVAVV